MAPALDAERNELAEMGRPLDGAALEAELLRGGVIVDRGMQIIALRMQHLVRRPPWPDQLGIALLDFGVEHAQSHEISP